MGKLSALNTLREKLGEDGVNALLEVIEEERERTRDYLFHLLEERFARRLAEEMGKLRSEMYKLFARHSAEVDEKIEGLRTEMTERIENLRTEMTEKIEGLRSEMTGRIENLNTEMTGKIEGLRTEMHDEIGKLRAEVHQEIAKVWNEIGRLRAEMTEKIEKLRSEMHSMKADIIKWMFVFWVSQTLMIVGVIFALMRFLR